MTTPRFRQAATATVTNWAERGWIPDSLLRSGIRLLLNERLAEESGDPRESNRLLAEALRRSDIALHTGEANEQHYEVPHEFFSAVLGPRLKYSCAWYGEPPVPGDLHSAEEVMLDLTVERADIQDGAQLLELGCGWGSFTLYAAEKFPNSRILAVSNSKTQREYILGRARALGLANLDVVTADVNRFEPDPAWPAFDRVVSVEMFEHVRNWERLLRRISGWMTPSGRLFVHHFCHRNRAYPYEDRDASDWMARHFFTGGLMPSEDWLSHCDRDLDVEKDWRVDGRHYALTSEAWLGNLDAQHDELLKLFTDLHGASEGARALQRWRMFFLACAELFAAMNGSEWFVRHARLARSGPL